MAAPLLKMNTMKLTLKNVEIEITEADEHRVQTLFAKVLAEAITQREIEPHRGTREGEQPMQRITVKEAAKMLNLSVSTIRGYTRSGQLTAYKIGKSVRYDPADIEALQTKKGPKEP